MDNHNTKFDKSDFDKHSLKNLAKTAFYELAEGDHTLALGLVDYLKEVHGLNINQIIRLAAILTKLDKLYLANTWLEIRRISMKTIH